MDRLEPGECRDREIVGKDAEQRIAEAVREEEDVRGLWLSGAEIRLDTLHSLTFGGCRFRNCRFTGTADGKLALVETTLEDCDLSNAYLSSALLRRVDFSRCRATGLLLARALANRVRMEDCVCRYLNLSA